MPFYSNIIVILVYFYRIELPSVCTPVEVTEGKCVACGNEYDHAFKVFESKSRKTDINLAQLLMKYCKIQVSGGSLCNTCFRQVTQLEKSHKKFRDKCTKTYSLKMREILWMRTAMARE